jgi:hypothetical protein
MTGVAEPPSSEHDDDKPLSLPLPYGVHPWQGPPGV